MSQSELTSTTTEAPTSIGAGHYLAVDEFLRRHKGLIGRTLFYEAVQRSEIPHVRVGRRILVPEDALDRMLSDPHSISARAKSA